MKEENSDLTNIENKIIECLNEADSKLNIDDFNILAESVIDYIDQLSRVKRFGYINKKNI
jgi:hypothetical protein